MASPRHFNDPFDCSLSFKLSQLSEIEISSLSSYYLQSGVTENSKLIFNQYGNEDLKLLYQNAAKDTLNKVNEKFLDSYGVCCFSETNDDLLMWGHYSEAFKGFCLEFRTDYEPFKKLHKVTYSDSLPTINTYELMINENHPFVKDLYCTKSAKWRYEKEWRILHDKAGTLFNYEIECLKAIYFGPKIDFALFEILCLILIGQNPKVELWKGKLSDNEFKIEFEKVNYTPYVIAKSLGLK